MPKAQEREAAEVLSVQPVESILDELHGIHQEIMNRAFEIFEKRDRAAGRAIEDWLSAERELTWRPAVEVTEEKGTLTLDAVVAPLGPGDLAVQATPEDILIRSERTHQDKKGARVHCCEFGRGKLFREVHLPTRIDPERARAEYVNGLLHITAPVVEEAGSHDVPIKAG